jgi:hypothetical protein
VRLDLAPLLAEQGEQSRAVELVEHVLSTVSERKAAGLRNEARRVLESFTDSEPVTL